MPFDDRTERNIATLAPGAQPWARGFMEAMLAHAPAGHAIRIISGNRTWKEQDELFAQGRTKPGRIVTNARGGQSNHNFGIAWDIGIFKGSDYLEDSPLYGSLAKYGKAVGVNWGGDWKSIKDEPHYEVPVGLSLAQMRALMAAGKSVPIPAYKGASPSPAPTDTVVIAANEVAVYDDQVLTPVRGRLIEGRLWLPLRDFVTVFGGGIEDVSGNRFRLFLNQHRQTFTGRIIDGRGYAKFVDLNTVLGWPYTYEPGRLTVKTKA